MDLGTAAAGSGLTAAIVGVIYGLSRLLKRSKCKSHLGCCDLDIARDQAQQTVRGNNEIVQMVLLALKEQKKREATKPPKAEELVSEV